MKYTKEQLMPKRYPENRPNNIGKSHDKYWCIDNKGVDYWYYWFHREDETHPNPNSRPIPGFARVDDSIHWFIDIPGAPEEVKPLAYPANMPEREVTYIAHKPEREGTYIAHTNIPSKLMDFWAETSWPDNRDWNNGIIDYFIDIRLEDLGEKEKIKGTMCASQAVQLECIRPDCKYNSSGGNCTIEPAVTLNENNTFVCWEYTKREPEIAPCPNPECRAECAIVSYGVDEYQVQCGECDYRAPFGNTPEEAVRLHNLIAWRK